MKQATHFSPLKILFLTLAMSAALNSLAEDAIDPSRPLYRNGGHFGPAGSDVALEAGAASAPGADAEMQATQVTQPQSVYLGTLYRNGGHFGETNSDQKLEESGSR